jgi:hypothetical protein
MTRAPYLSKAYNDATTGDLLITAIAATMDDGGVFRGNVGIDISLQHLQRSVLGTRILENGHAFVIDADGKVRVWRCVWNQSVYLPCVG